MIVIDACVAVKWFMPEPLSDAADAILGQTEARIAPEHMLVEVGNTLLKTVRAGGITLDHASEALAKLDRLVQLRSTRLLAVRAIEIADTVGCTNYDALYVAAAERWDADLVTADRSLVRQLRAADWPGRARMLGD